MRFSYCQCISDILFIHRGHRSSIVTATVDVFVRDCSIRLNRFD